MRSRRSRLRGLARWRRAVRRFGRPRPRAASSRRHWVGSARRPSVSSAISRLPRSEIEALKAEGARALVASGEAVRAAEAKGGEQQEALGREREEAERLKRDLAAARSEIEALKAEGARALARAVRRFGRPRPRASSSRRHWVGSARRPSVSSAISRLRAVRSRRSRLRGLGRWSASGEAVRAAEAKGVEQQEALGREREEAERLKRDLAAARSEIEALKAEGSRALAASGEAVRAAEARAASSRRHWVGSARRPSVSSAISRLRAARSRRSRLRGLARWRRAVRRFGRPRRRAASSRRHWVGSARRPSVSSAISRLRAVRSRRSRLRGLGRWWRAVRRFGRPRPRASSSRRHWVGSARRPSVSSAISRLPAVRSRRSRLKGLGRWSASGEAVRAAEAKGVEQQEALGREREEAERLKRDLAAAGSEIEALKAEGARALAASGEAVRAAEAKGGEQISQDQTAGPAPKPDPASIAATLSSTTPEQVLLARANSLLKDRDISGARLMLERALQAGSSRAAFQLAETYDPRQLSRWRAHGVRSDWAKAQELYLRAHDGGIMEAKDRIAPIR